MVSVSKLEIALLNSWDRESSSDPDNWTEDNPAWGQCAVTACLINDYLGGKIMWANAKLLGEKDISHYFNLVDNKEIDLTKRQFPEETEIPKGIDKTKGFASTRDYILSFEKTRKRYEILKERVKNYFNLHQNL